MYDVGLSENNPGLVEWSRLLGFSSALSKFWSTNEDPSGKLKKFQFHQMHPEIEVIIK